MRRGTVGHGTVGRGAVALVVWASLSGCSGGEQAPDRPVARATLHTTDTESFHHCPTLTAERLGRAAIAFSGTLRVEGVDGTEWVLEVDRWYTGGEEDVVVITAGSPTIDYFSRTVGSTRGGRIEDPVDWPEDGDRLLVAGPGLTRLDAREYDPVSPRYVGYAAGCLTQAWTPAIEELFEQAFPTPSARPVPR